MGREREEEEEDRQEGCGQLGWKERREEGKLEFEEVRRGKK